MQFNIAALVVLSAIHAVSAHTWTDQITRIASNGTFIGAPGYPRGYYPRSDALQSDPDLNVYELQGIADSANICAPTQQPDSPQPYPGYPKLNASAGEFIAFRYLENGHVTEPTQASTATITKGFGSGLVYVYGTQDSRADDKYNSIHRVWNKDGTGGDKRGKLLAVQYFDDMECYLAGSKNGNLKIDGQYLADIRAKAYPHSSDTWMGDNIYCQTDFQLPVDAKAGADYSIYWVWEWPFMTLDGVVTTNQSYTSCADITIEASSGTPQAQSVAYVAPQDYNYNAQWSQMVNPFVVDPTASQKPWSLRVTTDLFATPTVFASSAGASSAGNATSTVSTQASSTAHVAPTITTAPTSTAASSGGSPESLTTVIVTLTTYVTAAASAASSVQTGTSVASGTTAASSVAQSTASPPVVSPFLPRSLMIRGRRAF